MDSKAMRWGRSHKDDARQEYIRFLQVSNKQATITLSGLVVDSQNPCLACSPDGLVSIPGTPEPEGLVEIKCPHSAAEKQLTPQQAAESLKQFPCKLISRDGSGEAVLELSRKHNYFFQVQGQMAITERSWCDYVTWTPMGMSVERISFDKDFWEKVKPNLVKFHRLAILPELALPRYTSGQPIRELLKSSAEAHYDSTDPSVQSVALSGPCSSLRSLN